MTSRVDHRLDSAIRFFLYLLIFWLPYSHAVVETSVCVSVVLWVVKRVVILRREYPQARGPKGIFFLRAFAPAGSFLNRPIAIFLGLCLLSTAGSAFGIVSWRGFLTKTLEWFVVYFLVLEVFTERKHFIIAGIIFCISALATSLDALQQFYLTGKDIFFGYPLLGGRATAGFKHANGLGGYLTFVVPLALAFLFSARDNKRRLIGGVFVSLAFWAAFLTFSRGAWLGIVMGGAVFFVLTQPRILRALVIVLVLGGLLGAVVAASQRPTALRLDQHQENAAWRIEIWRHTLALISDRPFFGHGLNTFMMLFREYPGNFHAVYYDSPTYAHNCYLQMASEIGILGLGAFLWLIFKGIRMICLFVRKKLFEDSRKAILLAGLCSGAVAFLTHSFFDVNFYSLRSSVLFWLMMGFMVSLYKLLKDREIYGTKIV